MLVKELIEILKTIEPNGVVSIVNDGKRVAEENIASYDITDWWTDQDRSYIDIAIEDGAFAECLETIAEYESEDEEC